MVYDLQMTAEEYEAALAKWGLRHKRAAEFFGYDDITSMRYAAGKRRVPAPLAKLIRLMLALKLDPPKVDEWLEDDMISAPKAAIAWWPRSETFEEPGWYVALKPGGVHEIVQVVEDNARELRVLFIGQERSCGLKQGDAEGLVFLARLDPAGIASMGTQPTA